MDYKKAIDNTLSDMNGSFRPMSNAEFSRKVQERAEIMSSNEKNALHPGIVELSPVQPEHKSNKVFNVIAGIAGAAAVLAGAVFGLHWLNEHGGLKEGGIESSNGAGHSQNTAAVTTAGEEQPEFTYIFQAYSSDGLAAESDNNAEYTTVAEITPAETYKTTVTTEVSDITTTATAEWTDDTTYNIPQVKITDGMLDHTDVTLALGEGNVKILPGRIYDGRILKLELTGDIDDETHIGIRSVKNPRNIIQGGSKNDDGTFTFSALIDIPEGETDTLELLDIGTLKTEGKPKAIEVINVSGIKDYEPLTERVGLDMTQWGIPYETLEWLTLSPFGLELSFTSDTNWKSPNISVEWTTLNGTVCKSRGHSGTEDYDESTGKYHTTLLIVPDEDTDLTQMKEFSINGLKIKRAEFMPRSFWDDPEDYGETMTPVETFVQIAAPEE